MFTELINTFSNSQANKSSKLEAFYKAIKPHPHFLSLVRNRESILPQLCENLTLKTFKKKDIIFTRNQAVKDLYWLLEGEVGCWEKKNHDEIEVEIKTIADIKQMKDNGEEFLWDKKDRLVKLENKLNNLRNIEENNIMKELDVNNELFQSTNICKLKRVRSLGSGEIVGENCVIAGLKYEGMCIVASETCTVLHLDANIYKQMFASNIMNFQFIKDALLQVFGFSKIKYIIRLAYQFEELPFTYNQPIYKEGDIANCVYIIKSGEVELRQTHLNKLQNVDQEQDNASQSLIQDQNIGFHQFKRKTKTKHSNETQIALCAHGIIGLEDFEDNHHHREDSNEETHKLQKKKLRTLKAISKSNDTVLLKIRDKYIDKLCRDQGMCRNKMGGQMKQQKADYHKTRLSHLQNFLQNNNQQPQMPPEEVSPEKKQLLKSFIQSQRFREVVKQQQNNEIQTAESISQPIKKAPSFHQLPDLEDQVFTKPRASTFCKSSCMKASSTLSSLAMALAKPNTQSKPMNQDGLFSLLTNSINQAQKDEIELPKEDKFMSSQVQQAKSKQSLEDIPEFVLVKTKSNDTTNKNEDENRLSPTFQLFSPLKKTYKEPKLSLKQLRQLKANTEIPYYLNDSITAESGKNKKQQRISQAQIPDLPSPDLQQDFFASTVPNCNQEEQIPSNELRSIVSIGSFQYLEKKTSSIHIQKNSSRTAKELEKASEMIEEQSPLYSSESNNFETNKYFHSEIIHDKKNKQNLNLNISFSNFNLVGQDSLTLQNRKKLSLNLNTTSHLRNINTTSSYLSSQPTNQSVNSRHLPTLPNNHNKSFIAQHNGNMNNQINKLEGSNSQSTHTEDNWHQRNHRWSSLQNSERPQLNLTFLFQDKQKPYLKYNRSDKQLNNNSKTTNVTDKKSSQRKQSFSSPSKRVLQQQQDNDDDDSDSFISNSQDLERLNLIQSEYTPQIAKSSLKKSIQFVSPLSITQHHKFTQKDLIHPFSSHNSMEEKKEEFAKPHHHQLSLKNQKSQSPPLQQQKQHQQKQLLSSPNQTSKLFNKQIGSPQSTSYPSQIKASISTLPSMHCHLIPTHSLQLLKSTHQSHTNVSSPLFQGNSTLPFANQSISYISPNQVYLNSTVGNHSHTHTHSISQASCLNNQSLSQANTTASGCNQEPLSIKAYMQTSSFNLPETEDDLKFLYQEDISKLQQPLNPLSQSEDFLKLKPVSITQQLKTKSKNIFEIMRRRNFRIAKPSVLSLNLSHQIKQIQPQLSIYSSTSGIQQFFNKQVPVESN